ncbi:hypothetical protein FRX31_023825 [Thalictrum thalictroides]|uniref:Uncharacterized protein n=1 Tax=Thalictrum thalictroides TaxID=46969 RepID=A0A7J6VNB5_THATH|nr:hypothetical protein FRX31_023825 [Thalictrum thalictroides]
MFHSFKPSQPANSNMKAGKRRLSSKHNYLAGHLLNPLIPNPTKLYLLNPCLLLQRPMAEGNSKEAAGKRGSSGQEAAGKMGRWA